MRYWWVNQNQTYRHEIRGGYLWSPQRSRGDRRNPFYEFMREVSPGDVIFSFFDTRIAAIGFAESYCYPSPKPEEFGSSGLNWSQVGWRVDVRFQELNRRIRPKDHIDELRVLLPSKYAPLLPNGQGLQGIYLTSVSFELAARLRRLIGDEAAILGDVASIVEPERPMTTQIEWDARVEAQIHADSNLRDTDRDALIKARIGQGTFRRNVFRIEHHCRVTRVDRREHLIASHCKPWRESSNQERLDGENGLVLTPSVDHLFNYGFISFEGTGRLLVSPIAHRESLAKMGIPLGEACNVGAFSAGQRSYLEHHREHVFREARVSRAQ